MTTETPLKTCLRCGQQKPLTDFGRDVRNSDGHACYCIMCRRRMWRETHGGLRHVFARFTTEEIEEELNLRLSENSAI